MINSSWDIPTFRKHRVTKGGCVVGKGSAIGQPFHTSVSLSIAASLSSPTPETIYTVSAGGILLLSTLVIGTIPSGVALSNLASDGNVLAGVNGLSAGSLDMISLFGDFIPSIESLTLDATNSNTAAETVTVDLYGWLYPAYETVNVKVGG